MSEAELTYWTSRISDNLRRSERLRLWNYAALVLTVVISGVILWYTVDRYDGLRDDVRTACAGRVAALDLTEWVPVCRSVMPEDLER